MSERARQKLVVTSGVAVLVVICGSLFGCPVTTGGGGGGGLDSLFNQAPTVSGGDDVSTESGLEVSLTATGSDPDGDTLTYAWVLEGGPASLSGGSGQTFTFTAPTVDEVTVLIARVTVDDGRGGTASDEVRVTVYPGGDGGDPTKPWYMHAIAASVDDLTGSVGDDVKDWFSLSRAEASEEAMDALSDVLDAGEEGDFGDAFLQIDVNDMSVATGTHFLRVDPDNDYAVIAWGFAALELSTDGFLYDQLGLPVRIRPEGTIVAIQQATIDAVTAVVEDLFDDATGSIEDSLDALEDSGYYDAETMAVYSSYVNIGVEVISAYSEIPDAPNADGEVTFARDWNYDIQYPEYVVEYDEYGWPTYETMYHDATLDLSWEVDIEANSDLSRWEGAASVFGEVDPAPAGVETQSLGVNLALGLQKLSGPNVVWMEAGDGTIVDGSRLAGEWIAEFDGEIIGLDGAYGWLKFVFDGSGELDDVLVAGTWGDYDPYGGFYGYGLYGFPIQPSYMKPIAQEMDDAVWYSLIDELEELRTYYEQYDVTIPDEELRVTLTEGGDLRIDLLVEDAGEYLQEMLEMALLGSGTGLDIDLSGLPDFAIMSFVGSLADGTLAGDLMIFTLLQAAEFEEQ